MSDLAERYDIQMMAAYVRGAIRGSGPLFEVPLESLTEGDCLCLLESNIYCLFNRITNRETRFDFRYNSFLNIRNLSRNPNLSRNQSRNQNLNPNLNCCQMKIHSILNLNHYCYFSCFQQPHK